MSSKEQENEYIRQMKIAQEQGGSKAVSFYALSCVVFAPNEGCADLVKECRELLIKSYTKGDMQRAIKHFRERRVTLQQSGIQDAVELCDNTVIFIRDLINQKRQQKVRITE